MFTDDLHLDLISSLHSVFLYSYLFQLLQLILSYCRISQSQYLTPSVAYFCCTSPNYCIDKTYSLKFIGVSGVQGFYAWRRNLIMKWLEKIELGSCYLWFKTHLPIEFLGTLMPSEKLLQLLEHTTTGGKACDMMSLSLMYRLLQGLECFGTFYWLHLEWRDSGTMQLSFLGMFTRFYCELWVHLLWTSWSIFFNCWWFELAIMGQQSHYEFLMLLGSHT